MEKNEKRRKKGSRAAAWQLDESGMVIISDPSYSVKLKAFVEVDGAAPGSWNVLCEQDDEVSVGATMSTWHEDFQLSNLIWQPLEGLRGRQRKPRQLQAGVDTAQIGIFAKARYPAGDTGDFEDCDTFYGHACDSSSGIFEFNDEKIGALLKCTSDGTLKVSVAKNDDGKVIGIRLH